MAVVDEPKSKKAKKWPTTYSAPTSKPARPTVWRDALRHTEPAFVYANDGVARVIYDGYPKAKYHLLALPATGSALSGIKSISQLRPRHLEDLRTFHASVRSCADSLRTASGSELYLGYHALPSMDWLHCHIISTDLESPCLKTKHHYLGFTTDFLVKVDALEDLLQGSDEAAVAADIARRIAVRDTAPLACHSCRRVQPNMPALKHHIATCVKCTDEVVVSDS